MNWIAKEIKTKRTGHVNHNRTTIPGTMVWEFIHRDMPHPVGCLWIRKVGKSTFEILDVYVVPAFRRCRVATRMLESVIEHYEPGEIITGNVNRLSGPWLKKLKFEQDPELKHWKRLFVLKGKATRP